MKKTAMFDALERSGINMSDINHRMDAADRKQYGNNRGSKRNNNGYSQGKKERDNKEERFCRTYIDKNKKYFLDDEKKQLNPKFVDEYAWRIAGLFAGKVKITQIRGFYNTVCRINRKLNGNQIAEVNYLEVKAHVDMLKAHAKNKRKNSLVTDDFVEFIDANVNAIQGKEELKAFKMHFEAILGYMPKDVR